MHDIKIAPIFTPDGFGGEPGMDWPFPATDKSKWAGDAIPTINELFGLDNATKASFAIELSIDSN